jgi:hypothetical protein
LNPLAAALAEAGGVAAPAELTARLRDLVGAELARGERALRATRTGYDDPIAAVFAPASGAEGGGPEAGGAEGRRAAVGDERPGDAEAGGAEGRRAAVGNERPRGAEAGGAEGRRAAVGDERPRGAAGVLAALPLAAEARADAGAAPPRAWLVAAGAIGALVEVAGAGPARAPADLALEAGRLGAHLVLAFPLPGGIAPGEAAELAALAFDDAVAGVDRLRARGLAAPPAALAGIEDPRAPIGATHPFRVAEAVARLGGRPADEASMDELEDAVLALLEPPGAATPAHQDPDPARRVARRIVQRLDGMGKWGGYHTEFVHLARGFAGHDKALALEIGERLLAAGLLAEKTSVGQRHVFLNPRRSADVRALIEEGKVPSDLDLATN